ncbi:protein SENSITIVE TO UV 2-like isoform X2 [Triticum dicoccoides]|uniref:protein SENSITIVE TO UV 2-like isoform X2 n=1 Tax=Triticum dicoccoides TaxID=85692 RepID=UPI0018911E47|nr:protein SENSITIVE TO UV 2-like isoform X2 [Triticum dicoccoides]
MDGDGFDDGWWEANQQYLDNICREAEESSASRNPSTATPAPAPAPDPAATTTQHHAPPSAASCPPPSSAAPLSRVPAASYPPSSFAASAAPLPRVPASPNAFAAPASTLYRPPAAPPHAAAISPFAHPSHMPASAPLHFSPPRELSQRVPDAGCGGGFSPPREFSQRPSSSAAAEDTDCQITGAAGPNRPRGAPRERDARPPSQAHGDRVKAVPPRGRLPRAAKEKESKSAEELRRELERTLKQMNDLKNEHIELKKGMKEKDLEIEAKEAEIHNLKKANVDISSKEMDIDQPCHTPANEALHARGSCWTSTKRISLEESGHPELERNKSKDIKTKGVQTDLPLNSGHLERKKVLMNNISSNLCAIWGRPANSMLGRSLISKILASCSEEMLTLFQSARLPDKCETSTEASSSMNNAVSEVYDIIVKMNSDTIPIRTLLEALLNLCVVGNAVVVGRALRILHSILQNLLTHGTRSNQRNNVSIETYVDNNMEMEGNNQEHSSALLNMPDPEEAGLHIGNMLIPSTFWTPFFTGVLQIALKYLEEGIRVDALSIMILIVRTSDSKGEREKFGFISIMESLHQLLQKENALLVKKHSVHLLFLLLNCPVMLKMLCSGGKDGSELMETVGCENEPQQAINSVLKDLSECLTCEATTSLELKLCRLVVNLLAYIASSGKLGYEVLLGSVTAHGASFLELTMEVLASKMECKVDFSTEVHELLNERYLLMREVLILLNRLASHAMFSKPTLEVLMGSKRCAGLTIDIANRLPQRSKYPLRKLNPQMANDLADLAQKFRSRVYGFLEEQQHSTAERCDTGALGKPPRVTR